MLIGFDDSLAGEATHHNRIRGLLTSIHPAMERVLGLRIARRRCRILPRRGGLAGITAARRRKVAGLATKYAPRMDTRLVAEVFCPAATDLDRSRRRAAGIVLPKRAEPLKSILAQP